MKKIALKKDRVLHTTELAVRLKNNVKIIANASSSRCCKCVICLLIQPPPTKNHFQPINPALSGGRQGASRDSDGRELRQTSTRIQWQEPGRPCRARWNHTHLARASGRCTCVCKHVRTEKQGRRAGAESFGAEQLGVEGGDGDRRRRRAAGGGVRARARERRNLELCFLWIERARMWAESYSWVPIRPTRRR